jgi:hypothetical protein
MKVETMTAGDGVRTSLKVVVRVGNSVRFLARSKAAAMIMARAIEMMAIMRVTTTMRSTAKTMMVTVIVTNRAVSLYTMKLAERKTRKRRKTTNGTYRLETILGHEIKSV